MTFQSTPVVPVDPKLEANAVKVLNALRSAKVYRVASVHVEIDEKGTRRVTDLQLRQVKRRRKQRKPRKVNGSDSYLKMSSGNQTSFGIQPYPRKSNVTTMIKTVDSKMVAIPSDRRISELQKTLVREWAARVIRRRWLLRHSRAISRTSRRTAGGRGVSRRRRSKATGAAMTVSGRKTSLGSRRRRRSAKKNTKIVVTVATGQTIVSRAPVRYVIWFPRARTAPTYWEPEEKNVEMEEK